MPPPMTTAAEPRATRRPRPAAPRQRSHDRHVERRRAGCVPTHGARVHLRTARADARLTRSNVESLVLGECLGAHTAGMRRSTNAPASSITRREAIAARYATVP